MSHNCTNNFVFLSQYSNPGNPIAHYDNTAEEIFDQLNGQVDMIVSMGHFFCKSP